MNVIKAAWPAPSHIHAYTTTRVGGFSQGHYAQLNLAAHVGDDIHTVTQNRDLIKTQLHLPQDPCWLTQVHGTQAVQADTTTGTPDADASFTHQPNTVCAVLTADCLPLLLCNEAGTVVAAIHAGWKGLAAGIIEATVAQLGVHADSLLAWLGPAIGPLAFEVGEAVRTALLADCPTGTSAFQIHEEGKWLCNLYQLAHLRLSQLGIDKIYGGEYCTFTQRDLFYSYRRDNTTGRMATLIWMTS